MLALMFLALILALSSASMDGVGSVESQIVRLNVGGTVFCTTKLTLLGAAGNEKRNFFHGLLSGDLPSTRDETGAFFIDRDPGAFRFLLHWMRSGVLLSPAVPYTLEVLRAEAEYFGLDWPITDARTHDLVMLNVFGGATTANFVKAVQVEVYGPVSKACQRALRAFLDHYEQRSNNAFELPATKTEPSVSILIMCSCLDASMVFSLASIIAQDGWRVTSQSCAMIPEVPHQKTQSNFMRRDFVLTFERKL